ncbi:hypothetical protein [Fibrobacter sp. HC4]|uniref:hypothetical protein n=1 Tax=Fibrobacter sp. HC4 TaxID=3239812 RepID=UPI002019FE6B|nr:hypothetical protein [Fibrobacter succinogenes]
MSFVKIMACAASLLAVQSFAQPRDLFAEFEEEAAVADKAAADSVEAAKKAEADKKAAEEKVAAEKAAAEEKAEAERVAAEKQAAEEKAAAEKAADKAAADSAAAAQAAAAAPVKTEEELAAAQAAAAAPVKTEEELAAEQAAKRAAAEKAANIMRSTAEGAAAEAEKARAASDSSAASQDPYEGVDRNELYAREMQRISDSLQYISDSIALAQMTADSIAAVEKARNDSIQAYNDSIQAASASSTAIPSSSSMSRRDILGPVKVSKVNGLDDMKGKYKSPRKAMFMSLVVPGAGQLYVGGSTFTKVRGGVYLALEAALWGSWYYYSVYKYDRQVNRYKNFANDHFSIGTYETKMRKLYKDVSENGAEFRSRYLGSRESFCEAIFGDANREGCYNDSYVYYKDTDYRNRFVNNPKSLGDDRKKNGFYDESAVYQHVSDGSYVLGWDDVKDEAVAASLDLETNGSEVVALGTSSNQDTYRSMRNKANDYADMQAWFFGGIILNHIVSAVDAAFTAHAHNKALYQEDLSWYDRLHFDGGVVLGESVGVNVMASWGF